MHTDDSSALYAWIIFHWHCPKVSHSIQPVCPSVLDQWGLILCIPFFARLLPTIFTFPFFFKAFFPLIEGAWTLLLTFKLTRVFLYTFSLMGIQTNNSHTQLNPQLHLSSPLSLYPFFIQHSCFHCCCAARLSLHPPGAFVSIRSSSFSLFFSHYSLSPSRSLVIFPLFAC